MKVGGQEWLEKWGILVVSSGLAAAIAAGGSFATDRLKAADEARLRRCDIANTFLSDDTPSPYIDVRMRQAITRRAAIALDRCLQEDR